MIPRMSTALSPAARSAEFRFAQPITVRFNDFDLLGHVNNAVYLTYCEMARVGYWPAAAGDTMVEGASFIVAHISIDYRRPIQWHDSVQVCVRVSGVGSKSFTMEYRVLGAAGGEEFVAAEARSVQVMYDYTAGRSIPLSDTLIARLEAFEGRPLRR